MTGCNIHKLQAASKRIPAALEIRFHRHNDAHILKGGLFNNIGLVRADEQAHINGLAQVNIGDLNSLERPAVSRRRHDIGMAFSLQLDDIRAGLGGSRFPGRAAGCAAELERNQPIAVDAGAYMRRAGIEVCARHPAKLAMRICAFSNKCGPHGHDEIPAHALPNEMEIVVVPPDVRAGCADGIGLLGLSVLTRTGPVDRTDIRLVIELTEGRPTRRHHGDLSSVDEIWLNEKRGRSVCQWYLKK